MERVAARPVPAWLSLTLLYLRRDRWFGAGADRRLTSAVVLMPLVVAVFTWRLSSPEVVAEPAMGMMLGSIVWT
ncbi:MAG: hypothetical protein K6T30_06215, partial [Alicyclobacillus sp.]|nr:hypothetical protein [Alicyclobacillus sp.]